MRHFSRYFKGLGIIIIMEVSLEYNGDMKGAVKGAMDDYGCIPFSYMYADIINNLIQVMVKQITLITLQGFKLMLT